MKFKSILVMIMMTMMTIDNDVEETEQTEDSEKVEHFPPRLAHHGTCAVEIDNPMQDGNSSKPDKVADGDNISKGLAQLIA